MNKMTKKDLARSVQEMKPEVTLAFANDLVTCVFDEITTSLQEGDVISVSGFGTFKPIVRAARTARNPQTGAPIDVPEKTVCKFKAVPALNESLNE